MKSIYQVGDKVRIEDRISYFSSGHPVQKYAGTVMTVRGVLTFSNGDLMWYYMEEDREEFHGLGCPWINEDIVGLAEEFEEPLDDSTFPEITFEELLAGTIPERRTS